MEGIKSVERGDFIGRSSVVRKIRYGMPENVDLKYVTMDSREANI
ncbi:MAG: hypothetical protein ACJAQ6_001819, partial [Arenicella sp.]